MSTEKRIGPFVGWICKHKFYEDAVNALADEVTRALDEGSKFVFVLLGMSRAGKSEVLKDVLERFRSRVNASGQPRVRSLPIPTEVNRKSLPKAIIRTVIGDVDVDGDPNELKFQAEVVLVESETSVLMLDEANHWVEARTTERAQTKENRQLADWLKVLHEEKDRSLVIAGLPHSIRLLVDNTQLQGRALRPVYLRPYEWNIEVERREFIKAVQAFVTRMKQCGWEIVASAETVARGAYYCSGGLIGKVRDLLVSADELGHKVKRLDVDLLSRAYERRFPEGRKGNPFKLPEIPDVLLNEIHQQTLVSGREPEHQRRAARGKG